MWASVSTAGSKYGSKDGSNSVTGYNAILLDDDNFHIQAFIYPDKWSQIVNNHVPPLYPDYATDIIGVVENFEKLSLIPTKYGQRNIVKFRICDGRLAQQGYKTPEDIGSLSTVSNSVQVVETLTLKVEASDSWWYYGCNFCHEEVHLLEGRYKCVNPKCLKSSPYAEKRYRIMVLAHDKTEAVNVVLSDRVVKRLVGKTATVLLEEIEDLAETLPSTLFPQQILDIANKDVTFNILISDDNVLINSTMYNATDAYLSKKSKSSTSETVDEILESTESDFGEIS
ncbi:hypothetical protein POM88_013444 [Heracleum sosnowskyi]|uniref:Replication factor A C-terminal domain-containing protein n=1 Tax=Heracleum sosnowskyi TaxID=360622 RepID=A0AAD8IZW7_9APIA|nr:hypothetical protein POM88_013444 [Heracleum sosnowskyi]